MSLYSFEFEGGGEGQTRAVVFFQDNAKEFDSLSSQTLEAKEKASSFMKLNDWVLI